ncbi:srginyl-tRNA synthase [Rodentibacter pneumotropicus]|uniref:Arginine--tRNA ligase n=1 Tax=Rodentibacter pneumotropicus TaxID=758 RepID=A0A448MN08_9PAST|nr:srginyl-tRNA synthase [Rodentibacter pneumotropicus]
MKANRALVFSDTRQSQHMQQAWLITRKAGYVPDNFSLEHKNFGMMLGKDGKPFKTRTGGTVKLADLLDEAIDRAAILINEKSNNLSDTEKVAVAEAVGIGSVKYADLSKNRTTDYVFDWDNMLSFEGNTAPYMQYAYTRIRSIFNKTQVDLTALSTAPLMLVDEKERSLAIKLLQFEEAVQTVGREGMPHVLCAYLYELAGVFSSFYEHCPILNAEDEKLMLSRLKLALLTEKTLKQGLDLLGIKTVDKCSSKRHENVPLFLR